MILDCSARDYHEDRHAPEPSLSSTVARLVINRSPRHAWTAHPRLNPDYAPTEKAVFDIGRAAHRAILGRGDEYVAYPDEYLASNGAASTKAAKEWAEEQRAAGRTPLKYEDCARIEDIAEAVTARLAEMRIAFDYTRSEIAALAQIDGVYCRAMFDNVPENPKAPIYDIKTCEDASSDAVIRSVVGYGYAIQAAWYLDVWRAVTGESRRFRFVFVEKSPPHEVSVVELDASGGDADWMDDARAKCAEARRIWRECLDANEWPGYPRVISLVGAPTWYRQQWADRETGMPVTKQAIERARQWQSPEGMK
jgi:hypothetical protein